MRGAPKPFSSPRRGLRRPAADRQAVFVKASRPLFGFGSISSQISFFDSGPTLAPRPPWRCQGRSNVQGCSRTREGRMVERRGCWCECVNGPVGLSRGFPRYVDCTQGGGGRGDRFWLAAIRIELGCGLGAVACERGLRRGGVKRGAGGAGGQGRQSWSAEWPYGAPGMETRRACDHGDREGDELLAGSHVRGISATTTRRPLWQAGHWRGSFPTRRR